MRREEGGKEGGREGGRKGGRNLDIEFCFLCISGLHCIGARHTVNGDLQHVTDRLEKGTLRQEGRVSISSPL